MATSTFRNKNDVRPKKCGTAKRQRIKSQKKRLAALGVPEAALENMQADKLRKLLLRPKLTQKIFAQGQ